MLIVHVFVHVKPGQVDAFKTATLANAAASVEEPGVARFDVLQEKERPERFVLVEVYRTTEDPAKHKETAHYATWRDSVEPMMAEKRQSTRFENVFPGDDRWDTVGEVR